MEQLREGFQGSCFYIGYDLMLNSLTPPREREKGLRAMLAGLAKSYQKYVQMRLWDTRRENLAGDTQQCSAPAAAEREFKNLCNGPDTPGMSPVPSSPLQSIPCCFLPYPTLCFPHRETPSQGHPFPSECCSSQTRKSLTPPSTATATWRTQIPSAGTAGRVSNPTRPHQTLLSSQPCSS